MSQIYPKWRYHAEYEARLVRSFEQDAELGEGWEDNPSVFGRDTENAPNAKPFVIESKNIKKNRKRGEPQS